MTDNTTGAELSRRQFLQTSAVGAGLLWQPIRRLRSLGVDRPAGFPSGIELYRQVFENWALEIRVDDLLTCAPRAEADVVRLADWAAANGWRLRPRGKMHGWAPFTVASNTKRRDKVVLVDTTQHLDGVEIGSPQSATVRVQAGVLMDDLLQKLEDVGLGMTTTPAPGSITIGGALAVNAHGAALPAAGEDIAGNNYGSLSNRIVSLTAVVWDEAAGRHRLRTFQRSEPITKALLTNLGRVFVTSATLRVERNVNLRCISYTDIPSKVLFAAPAAAGPQSFAAFVERFGRAEAIVFPFTTKPWFKTWEVSPTKPAASRAVTEPYNYPFSDNIPLPIARLARKLVSGNGESTPTFGQMSYDFSVAGLAATNSSDIWGPSKNLLLYIKASTLRAAEFGYGVLTSRSNIQRVLHEFVTKHEALVKAYAKRGLYPASMPLDLRCTGVEDPTTTGVPGAEPPVLSSLAPRADHPEWDVVIWINSLSLVGSSGEFEFKRELESWMLANYSGDYASARVEWSKGWAYTGRGGWSDAQNIGTTIPDSFRAGRTATNNWDWAVAQFDQLDPHRVFSNKLLDMLLR